MSATIAEEPKEQVAQLNHPDTDFFSDYGVAWNYVHSAENAHDKQWKVVVAIEEHLEGKKPMDQRKLDEMGMSWAFNYNFHRARGMIERATSEFVSKINNAVSLGYPEFRIAKKEDNEDSVLSFLADNHTRGIVSAAIGCAFSEMMEKEGGINTFLNKTEYLSYTFGYCPISWPSNDWKGDPIHLKYIASRPGAEIEDLAEWVIFKTHTANWLYRHYVRVKNQSLQRTEDGQAFKSNWNIDALEAVLVKLYKGKIEKDGRDHSPETWAEVLPLYQKSPSLVISNSSDIRLAKIYYQEADDSITELYIPWGAEWTNPNDTKGQTNGAADATPMIIFKRHYRNGVTPRELLDFVRDSGFTTTGEISKMRGMGKIAVEDSTRYNRLRNSIHNKSLFSGSPWFETSSTQGKEKFKVTMSQGFILMPEGSNFVERQPTFQISEHIGLLGFEEREFSSNTQHFDPTATSKLSSRPTKDEIALATAEAGRSRAAKDTVKISDYARIFGRFIKKMGKVEMNPKSANYKGHRLFFDLILQAIPDYAKSDEDVKKILEAVDSYSISMVLGDTQALTLAINMSETPFGRNRARRMMLIALGFSRREVDIQVPLYTDKYRSMQDARIAAIENDMFWTTNEVIFQETDDDIVHLESHQAKMQRVFQGAREGKLDIVQAYKYCLNLEAHMLLHVDSISNDPTLENRAKEWIEVMKQNKNVIGQMAYAAEKAMKERQEAEMQQSAISPKDAASIRREDAVTMANQQRKDWQAQQRVRQQDEKQTQQHQERIEEIHANHELDMFEASIKS
jgi:hypothetical protein